jgi:alkylation response protein AidB-like acyl-CoA dehydrogenase
MDVRVTPGTTVTAMNIRETVAQWARANWDPGMTVREWWQLLADERYSLPSLPEHAYGRAYSRQEENEVKRGLSDVGTLGPPGGIATMMAAPTIAAHGTPEQIEEFVKPILEGTTSWCQLFSEPGAGSDLAGLQTRAERDGDEWIVNGQKVWTSLAAGTDYGMLLARTDPDQPKHSGITWFAFPMMQDGVDIRPLVEMTGQAFFNEVFMDDTRVPDANRIGDLNDGWRVGNTTLAFERGSLAGAGVELAFARAGSTSVDLDQPAGGFGMRTEGGPRPQIGAAPTAVRFGRYARDLGLDDAARRDARVRLHIREEVNRLLGQRARSGAVPAIGNLGKLAMSEIARMKREAGNQSIGALGMLTGDDAAAGPGNGEIQAATLHSPAPSIYGGTDQVQRNILGERFLGLPKEPGPAKTTPFRDLPKN